MNKNMRILAVDDEENIRDSYKKLFSSRETSAAMEKGMKLFNESPPSRTFPETNEYELVLAENGEQAIEFVLSSILSKKPFAAAFIDMKMPGIDGARTAKKLWEIDPRMKIVIVTAFSEYLPDDIIRIAGRDDLFYLNKPFRSDEIRQFARTLTSHWNLERKRENQLKTAHDQLQDAYMDTINRLVTASEYKDPETYDHILRMSRYSELIAKKIGMTDQAAEDLRHASPMHDIGKIGIPDSILLKPGKLAVEEFEIMKTHCSIGAKILARSSSKILRLAQSIAVSHHESWNGKGYPLGHAKNKIPIEGRIIKIADVFDALTSKRPYKDPYPIDVSCDIMKKDRERLFDPDILDAFFNSIDEALSIKKEVDSNSDVKEFTWSERDIDKRGK